MHYDQGVLVLCDFFVELGLFDHLVVLFLLASDKIVDANFRFS